MQNRHWILTFFIFLTLLSGKEVFASSSSEQTIHEIPPTGYVINAPGTYVFKESLTWNSASDGAAITIQANDVTLNMHGHKLSSSSGQFRTVGIVANNCVNLQIVKGKIEDMTLAGIQCNQCTNLIIKKIVVDGLNINDTANYTVPTGILANQCLNVTIDHCTVKNVDVQTGSLAAIQLTETLYSIVKNCKIKNMLNRDGACTGIGHLLCDNAIVSSCKLYKLKSQFIDNLNTEGHTTIGLVPVLSTNLLIENCKIKSIVGCCDDAHGMSIFLCEGAKVNHCQVYGVVDGIDSTKSGAKATGIEVYASFVNVSDCYVKNITAFNPQDKQATGFSCALCTGVKFQRCKAKNVNVLGTDGKRHASIGYGTGFGWAPDPRPEFVFPAIGILYEECEAKYCQVGFDSWFHIDSLWNNITSDDCSIPVLIQENGQRTLSCNPCSECGCQQPGCYPNPNYSVTITNVAANNLFVDVKVK